MTYKPTFRYSTPKRRLKPEAVVALGVMAVSAIIILVASCHQIDKQLVHPYGQDVPAEMAATATARPGASADGTATTTPVSGQAPWAGQVIPGQPVPDQVARLLEDGWHIFFRETMSYEQLQAGRAGDKAWWLAQAEQYYAGDELANRKQGIEDWFGPKTRMPGAIENARYDVTIRDCWSDTACTLWVRMESGDFWTYNVESEGWTPAGAVGRPYTHTVSMQYDPTAGRWKVARVGWE